jgi:hypothetical protein
VGRAGCDVPCRTVAPCRDESIGGARSTEPADVATALATYEVFLPPLTPQQREDYYEESKLIGELVGLARHQLPSGWSAFVDNMGRCYPARTSR